MCMKSITLTSNDISFGPFPSGCAIAKPLRLCQRLLSSSPLALVPSSTIAQGGGRSSRYRAYSSIKMRRDGRCLRVGARSRVRSGGRRGFARWRRGRTWHFLGGNGATSEFSRSERRRRILVGLGNAVGEGTESPTLLQTALDLEPSQSPLSNQLGHSSQHQRQESR